MMSIERLEMDATNRRERGCRDTLTRCTQPGIAACTVLDDGVGCLKPYRI